MANISCCIVLYQNDRKMLMEAVNSFLHAELSGKLFLIDNSPTDELKNLIIDDRVVYEHNPSNPGFGAAHNIAIKKAIECNAKYHLVLNPDIYFESYILKDISNFLDNYPGIGVLMPKILYPDNSIQYVAKLLPSPFDFIIRRFIPFKAIKHRLTDRFELRKSKYNQIMDVPFLSGCFMMLRLDVLAKVKGFDEQIFMYMEDIDLCRKIIDSGYRSVFYPLVSVYHDHEVKSFRNLKTLKVYLKSAVYYFNKWGWFFDEKRIKINKKTLEQL